MGAPLGTIEEGGMWDIQRGILSPDGIPQAGTMNRTLRLSDEQLDESKNRL